MEGAIIRSVWVLLGLIAFLAAPSGPAFSGEEEKGGSSSEPPPSAQSAPGGPPPSAGAQQRSGGNPILDRLDLHPNYTTSYSVNRTSKTWDQNLNTSRSVGALSFTNTWNLNQRRDEAQSNLRSKRGMMSFKSGYGLGQGGLWTVGLNGTFRRDAQLSTRSDQVENRSDLSMSVESKLAERIMHRLSFLQPFSLSSAGNVGYGADRSVSRRAARRDSTWVNGLIQHYEAGLSGGGAGVTITGNVAADDRRGNSKTRQRDAQGLLVDELRDKTDSRSRNLDGSIAWNPTPALQASANTRWVHEVNQYWDIQANNQLGGQESKDGRDVGSMGLVEWRPADGYRLHAELSNGESQATYKLQNKDFKKKAINGKIEGTFRVPKLAGPLAGTDLQAGYDSDETRNTLEEAVDYRQTNRHLKVGAGRKLGRKLQMVVNQDMNLLQYFYADRSNDRDERRFVTDGVMNYTASPEFSGYFNINLGQRKAVSIPGARSANNTTNKSYRVSTQLTYNRGSMRIEQQYTIQADYIYYQFQKNQDALIRTNGVLTNFSHTLGKKIGVGLQHDYQFTESGRYGSAGAGQPRLYSALTEETRQMLTLSAGYPLWNVIRLDARQMFELRRSGPAKRPGLVRTFRKTKRGDFSIRGDLQQKFSNNLSLQASFQKTQSLTERTYWTIRASVTKGF